MTIPLSDTPTVGLGQFIKEVRFQVPSHQRDYSWKEEYVRQFLDDITGAMRDNEQIYFCGLMVFTKDDEFPEFHVLDGQQRLATTLMTLSAVRNWMKRYTAYQRAQQQIEDRYLGDSDLGEDKMVPKLALNAANNDLFRRFVIESVPPADIEKELKTRNKEDRNRALLEATVYLNRRVQDIADGHKTPDEAKEYLLKLIAFITNTVKIVRLVVAGDEAAYTIFETLNDRGLDLAPLDLVKNFLFSRAERPQAGGRRDPNRLRDLEERWTEMMTILNAVKADAFLRTFWASRHGTIEGRKIFKAFKCEYHDAQLAYKVSLELRQAAERYVALSDPDDPVWAPYSEKAKETVSGLAVIGATQLHPVTLAALEKFEKREMERVLRLLEVIAGRYQLVERGRPGRMESLGARTAKLITEGKIRTATQVLSELKELYIPDRDFESRFATKVERESKKAAYLMRGLERQTLLRAQDQHVRELIPGSVTVEHILPKSPKEGWRKELDEDPELLTDCLYRLGNLCLLADMNRSLGNKPFSEKKKVFLESKMRITSSVAKYEHWGRKQIDERQQHLAELAVAYWRFQ